MGARRLFFSLGRQLGRSVARAVAPGGRVRGGSRQNREAPRGGAGGSPVPGSRLWPGPRRSWLGRGQREGALRRPRRFRGPPWREAAEAELSRQAQEAEQEQEAAPPSPGPAQPGCDVRSRGRKAGGGKRPPQTPPPPHALTGKPRRPPARLPSAAAAAMTLPVFFGCAAIAFGPALALFLLTVVAEPLRIIILIAGAFFWLVSLLLSSLVWFIAAKASDPSDEALQTGLLIFGVVFSVLLQEAFRFLYYKLLRPECNGPLII